MNKVIKKKWLKELRSGKYLQCQRSLKVNGKYCCLGVLCDIHRKETKGKWVDDDKDNEEGYLNSYNVLPIEVKNWAELNKANPSVTGQTLAYFNDEVQASFNEIADLIEKHL